MPEKNAFKGEGLLNLLLVTAFFVSPLLFFTDLTRNPYYLQITLLNISLLAAMAVIALNAFRGHGNFLPRLPLNMPAAALLAVYLCSFIYAYFNHAAFFRPAMASEGLKTGLFTLVNCFFVFYLSLRTPFAGPAKLEEPGVNKWLALILLWGAMWFLFPFIKSPVSAQDFWSRFWDPYGGVLWLVGAAAVYLTLKKPAKQEDVLGMIMAAAGISALYGVLEYFHIEMVWAKLVNPYGNRSVSTFGNPNFISSYVVMLLPLAAYYLAGAKTLGSRLFYGILFFSYEGMLMASLTRSSWIGAAVAFIFLFSFRAVREKFSANRKFLVPFFSAALVVLIFWPSASLKPFSSGLFERVSEGTGKINSVSSLSLSAGNDKIYPSYHQRLLIWTSAWQMGLENPLLGKGWGLFELFYPFYQGNLIFNYEAARSLRTHANNAHNEAFEQWSQAGLLGLGVYLWFFFTLGAGFYFYYRRSAPEAAASAVPLAAALAGMFADNMFNVSLHFAVPGLLFWWLTGALALKVFSPAPSFSLQPSAADSPPKAEQASVTAPVWLRRAGLAPLFWDKLLARNIIGGTGNRVSWAKSAGLAALVCFCALSVIFWQRQFTREFYYFNGFKEMRRNNFAQAARELKKAYDQYPREVNTNYELANAYVRAGEFEKAEWAYAEALNANAGYDEIYFNLAVVQRRTGKTPEALSALKTSAFINPLSPQVYQALAEIYISSSGVALPPGSGPAVPGSAGSGGGGTKELAAKEGVRLFSDAVRVFPDDGNMWNTLGYFYTLQKDLPGAKMAYGRGVRVDPDNKMLAENLAGIAVRMKIKDDPDVAWLERYGSASAGLAGGDINKAVKEAGALLNLDPGNAKLITLKAKLLFKAGDMEGAKTLLLILLKRNPADNAARYGLAVTYEKEGDFSSAKAEWERFLQFEPGNASVAARLKALP
ncbi:MAG: tetratricopeptide repeat protein [Elusimicrobia bacterium]|nr:tetratricopeptide repeat protein [Elusimicrobiota bacterium]